MSNNIFVIAEIGQAHDGSLGLLHSFIDAVAETGANAVKFQTHIAEAESSLHEPFRIKFSYVDNTRFDYWKRMSFSESQWFEIKSHCDEVGLEFISSPFSIAAVELLEKLGVKRYKIGSGEVNNKLMLDVIKQTGKEIILSSGMSSFDELDIAVDNIRCGGNKLSVLQCTSKYPTQPQDVGLNVLTELAERYRLDVGFSDHSGTVFPCLAAATLGAKILEAHIVFDKRMFGPDASSSLSVDEFKYLVDGVRFIESSLENPIDKHSCKGSENMKSIFEKSLAVNKALPVGHIIKISDLESKKPSGYGVPASQYELVIGKTLNRAMEQWEFLNYGDCNE